MPFHQLRQRTSADCQRLRFPTAAPRIARLRCDRARASLTAKPFTTLSMPGSDGVFPGEGATRSSIIKGFSSNRPNRETLNTITGELKIDKIWTEFWDRRDRNPLWSSNDHLPDACVGSTTENLNERKARSANKGSKRIYADDRACCCVGRSSAQPRWRRTDDALAGTLAKCFCFGTLSPKVPPRRIRAMKDAEADDPEASQAAGLRPSTGSSGPAAHLVRYPGRP